MGLYTKMSRTSNGKAVFRKAGAAGAYLHYAANRWYVGDDYRPNFMGSYNYNIRSNTTTTADCPALAHFEAVGGGSHTAHGVVIACDRPSPHPTCCDDVYVSGGGSEYPGLTQCPPPSVHAMPLTAAAVHCVCATGEYAEHSGGFTILPRVASVEYSLGIGGSGGTSCDSQGRPVYYNAASSKYLFYCPGYLNGQALNNWYIGSDYTSRSFRDTASSSGSSGAQCPTAASGWRAWMPQCTSRTRCACGAPVISCDGAAAACSACGSGGNYQCTNPGTYTCDATGDGGNVGQGGGWSSSSSLTVGCGAPPPPNNGDAQNWVHSIEQNLYTTSDCSGAPTQTRTVTEGECANPAEGVGQILETCAGGVATTKVYTSADCTGDFEEQTFTADRSCASLPGGADENGNVAFSMHCVQTAVSGQAGNSAVGIGIGVAVAAILLLVGVVVAIVCYRRRKQMNLAQLTSPASFQVVHQAAQTRPLHLSKLTPSLSRPPPLPVVNR